MNRDPKAPAIVPRVGAEEVGAARKSGSQATVSEGQGPGTLLLGPGQLALPGILRANSTVWPGLLPT